MDAQLWLMIHHSFKLRTVDLDVSQVFLKVTSKSLTAFFKVIVFKMRDCGFFNVVSEKAYLHTPVPNIHIL